MKTPAPIHIDRLARMLAANGIILKRAKVIEIAAAAFGFHNSNEFQTAARKGYLTPPRASLKEIVELSDGTNLLVLQDPIVDKVYGIPKDFIGNDRSSSIAISPYGGLVAMPDQIDDVKDLGSINPSPPPLPSSGQVLIDLDTLSSLVEGADSHADMLNEDIKDDSMSEEHRDSSSKFLEQIETAVQKARRLCSPEHVVNSQPSSPYPSFSLIHNETLARLIDAADSHLQDALSGVEEGIYDAEQTEWTTDLKKVITSARNAIPKEALELSSQSTSISIAESLEAAVGLAIWDDDAVARKDAEIIQDITETKITMMEAARLLRTCADKDHPLKTILNTNVPVWLTDIEGNFTHSVSKEDLDAMGLESRPADEEHAWTPLTEKEMSYLQPGVNISGMGSMHRNSMWTPDLNGIEVKLGQSCLWMGQKWQVPSIEFSFGEGGKAEVFKHLEDYVRDLRPLVERLGGNIVIRPDATDFSHEIDVFLPMDLAIDFEEREDWARALAWLLCPAGQRKRLTRVMASFNTSGASPGYDATWDATFDVLREGKAQAVDYLNGKNHDQMIIHYVESSLAHKDAWALWNEDWEMELDRNSLRSLYSI